VQALRNPPRSLVVGIDYRDQFLSAEDPETESHASRSRFSGIAATAKSGVEMVPDLEYRPVVELLPSQPTITNEALIRVPDQGPETMSVALIAFLLASHPRHRLLQIRDQREEALRVGVGQHLQDGRRI
jgi:hypothetical protein